jgi:transposase
VFEQLFEEVVARGLAVGLVRGDKLSVDGTFVEANGSKESRIPRENSCGCRAGQSNGARVPG